MTKTFSNMSPAQVERLAKINLRKSKEEEKNAKKKKPGVHINIAEALTDPTNLPDDSMFKEMKKRPHA